MAILGAILGDIAGSPFEFQYDDLHMEIRRSGDYKLFSDDFVRTGINEATDDSLMSIACMEACKTDMDFAKHYREIGRIHFDSDFGSHFRVWLMNEDMGPYNSCGNGAAMRCSYCADAFFEPGDYSKAIDAAVQSAKVTHNHPEGIKGAAVLTTVLCMIKDGKSKKEIEEYAVKEYPSYNKATDDNTPKYPYGVDRPYNDYVDTYGYDVTCQGSVPVAIRCFLDSNSFEDCCRRIIAMPCDTDTLCAIAGPMCEEFYGHCMGSKEKDEELVRKYLSEDMIAKLEQYHIIGIEQEKEI